MVSFEAWGYILDISLSDAGCTRNGYCSTESWTERGGDPRAEQARADQREAV